MTRRAATPDEPGADEEQEDATAFLGDWLARASARGDDPQPVERPVPRAAPEPDAADGADGAEQTTVPAEPPREPPPDQSPPITPAQPREQTSSQPDDQPEGQSSFDFGAFYSSLGTGPGSGADAPTGEPVGADPEGGATEVEATEVATPEVDETEADEADGAGQRTVRRPPTAGAHADRNRKLFRRRARSRRAPESSPATDESGPSDPPPPHPDPSASEAPETSETSETPAAEPALDLPPVPAPDYDSFYARLLGVETGRSAPEPQPEPDPEPEPEPEPDPAPEPAAVDAFTARTPFVAPADEPESPAEPEPEPEPPRHLHSSKITPAPSATPPAPSAVPQVVEFPRPRAPRVLLTVLLLITGVAAALAIWQAAQTEAGYDIGIAGALTALTLVFWWGLTTSPVQQVAVRGGILEIEDRESHFTFDLRNPTTRIDVEGTPGSRDWRVTIYRHRLSPYVITRRTVDSERFSEVLEHYRSIARKAEEQRLQQRTR